MSAGWNFVQTGPALLGNPGNLEIEDRSWQGYVEFLPFPQANGGGPWRVDQGGNITVSGLTAQKGGTDTSGTATASSPSFVSGTALQVNATQDTMLYLAITTAAALAVAIGPTSGVATALIPSATYGLSVITIRVPKGWYVKITGTIADMTITAVTC